MKQSNLAMAVALGSTVLVSGCANFSQNMEKVRQTVGENSGKLVGTLAGAAAGALACDGDPVCIAAGAVGGLILGNLYDKRQKELRKVAEERGINIETNDVKTFNSDKHNGHEMAINEGAMFEVGSADLKTKSRLDLMHFATIYRDKPQKILVIGHSDASGSDTYNQQLSERRARTVAKLFEEVGVPSDQIYFQGAGESQPIATNDTPEGRSMNRRVEIVEIDSEQALAAYNLQRQNNRKYLTHSNRTAEEKEQVRKRVKATPKQEPASEPTVAAKKPVAKPIPAAKALVDFGGRPASSDFTQITRAAGDTSSDSNGISFSLFSKAVADTPSTLSPCFMEAPRITGDIQNLGTGKKLDVADLDMTDFWPGLNGNVWYDTLNGHMVAYQDLRVMRDSGSPQGRPTVRVYENVQDDKTADFVSEPHIESYPGEKGLLLRTYFTEDDPMQCMDVVMPNNGKDAAKAGVLYYAEGQGLYEQEITLRRIQ